MPPTTHLRGEKVRLRGDLPEVGQQAPNSVLATTNVEEVPLTAYENKVVVLNVVPSFDTEVCSLSAQTFYKELKPMSHVVLLNISNDLPFAQKRFCGKASLNNKTFLSAFRSDFGTKYGLLMTDGPLKGLLARAVLLLNKGVVAYKELVPEISQEPNYQQLVRSIPNA